LLLQNDDSPHGFARCFFLASLGLVASFFFIALTREPESPPQVIEGTNASFWKASWDILRRDSNFRWFLVVRMLSQLSVTAFSFYTVYAVRRHHMSDAVAGLMMGVFTIGQIIANPILGRLGDRWSHPSVMKIGALAASLSALVAWLAPGLAWFALVYVLAGLANVAIWTIGLAIVLEFGTESERPVYIGLSNTLVAPVTILAPILGGWLADTVGFGVTFLFAAVCGLLTALVLHALLRDPRHIEIGDRRLEAMD
jgi:predicted MFS family arabinose efflux permease